MEKLLKSEGVTQDSMQGKIKKMRDKIMQKRDVVPEEEKKDPSMDTVNIIISKVIITSIKSSIWKIYRKSNKMNKDRTENEK